VASRLSHQLKTPTCSHWFLVRGFFYPEYEDGIFLWNVGSHKITQRHIPEDGILNSHCCENLKSYINTPPNMVFLNFISMKILRRDFTLHHHVQNGWNTPSHLKSNEYREFFPWNKSSLTSVQVKNSYSFTFMAQCVEKGGFLMSSLILLYTSFCKMSHLTNVQSRRKVSEVTSRKSSLLYHCYEKWLILTNSS
jgi:hypothetical protein